MPTRSNPITVVVLKDRETGLNCRMKKATMRRRLATTSLPLVTELFPGRVFMRYRKFIRSFDRPATSGTVLIMLSPSSWSFFIFWIIFNPTFSP